MKSQSGCQILSKTIYSITNTLVGCTNSNSSTQINWGSSYSGTISASSGYTLEGATISITMSGVDITSTAYNNGTILIAAVTGVLVISVTAVDSLVPTVTIMPTSQTTFSWSATDNVGVTDYAINTTGLTPTSWTSGSSGTYTVSASGTVYVFAKDAQGNIGSSSVNVYSVANLLTNCSSNNSDLIALAGYGYTATISASSGYVLDTASVIMGGTDITSTAYISGIVTIASVSGNIAITVSAVEQTSKVFGVSWTNDTSTTMTRTDDATNMSYSINTTTGEITSDFSSEFPYNQMTRETDLLGNVFVNIPSMWFRVTTDANNYITGVAVSDTQGSGSGWYQTRAFKYGAYGASSDGTVLKSVSGATRYASITRETARTEATANGTGYHQRDLYAGTILMFLWWIEFATKNSQSIMTGYVGAATRKTGGTDNLGFSNGYNPTLGNQMIWHGIEDFYGNIREWEDGITGNGSSGGVQYVSDNYTLYNDTGTGMNTLAFNSPTTSGNNLIAMGWDNLNPFLVQPIETSSDSYYTTGFCDYVATNNNICSNRGSPYGGDAYYGVSYFGRTSKSDAYFYIGCRLIKNV